MPHLSNDSAHEHGSLMNSEIERESVWFSPVESRLSGSIQGHRPAARLVVALVCV